MYAILRNVKVVINNDLNGKSWYAVEAITDSHVTLINTNNDEIKLPIYVVLQFIGVRKNNQSYLILPNNPIDLINLNKK